MIRKLWKSLTKRRRMQFWLLLALMIAASLAEIISIASVVPFLSALTSPEVIYHHESAQYFIEKLSIGSPSELLLPMTIVFIISTMIAGIIRLLLLYVSTRLSFAAGADISIDIYRRTLYQDYSVHTSRNSSEVINSIITKTNTVIGDVLVPLLGFVSSVIIMTGIVTVVFNVNAEVATISFSTFGLLYILISFFNRTALKKNSLSIALESTKKIKCLQEGLGGIRDVLIDGTQEFYCKIYQKADLSLRKASGNNIFIASSPRFIMEALGMVLIAILAYFLTLQKGGVVEAIPVLGALAVAAQKLLPALQQAYLSYSIIKGSRKSFMDVLDLLDQPLPQFINDEVTEPANFEKDIVFKDVSFRYKEDAPWILKNVNLKFKKGEKIGFVGMTGKGKSTLLDILMGLLVPTSGELLIDGISITEASRRAWQKNISHVPQSIFLSDSSMLQNIAFGDELDAFKESKAIHAAERAQISEMMETLSDGYNTSLGERGVQLSGGQRQRVGIARALYKQSSVLVLDEATSSLDYETEEKIMQEINTGQDEETVFIIAHRLTTLNQCDHIIRLSRDYKIEKLTYDQLIVNVKLKMTT
jgi:ABC-type multidrug transport system fused ATPase/permease subunit